MQVASQLLSAKEKLEVCELVDTMIGYGFTYKTQTGFGVNPAAGPQLDPAFGKLAEFGVREQILERSEQDADRN